jgi:HEPN domain-containing protein
LLTTLDIPFQKTHSIKELVYLLEKKLPESLLDTLPLLEMQRAAKLDRYYLPSRYPDAQFGSLTVEDLYDEEDAADSINKSEFLYQKSLEIASGVLGRPAYPNESVVLHLDQLLAKVQRLEQRIAHRESSMTDSAASSITGDSNAPRDCDQPPPRCGPR